MKRANRTELRMSKHIRGLSWDRFSIVVPTEEAEAIKKEYEKQGYVAREGFSYSKKYKY